LITDTTKTKGAILHIIPDDDPVAGEEAEFYFDMQSQLAEKIDSVELVISDLEGNKINIETEMSESLVTAKYTFPTQGAYEVTYLVKSDGQTYTFTESQRVSRGVSLSTEATKDYEWAKASLVFCVVSFLVLTIVFVNRFKDITTHSTF
jgi:hypothetical protein